MLECPYCFSIYCSGYCDDEDDKRNPLTLSLIELVIGDANATNRIRVNQTEVANTV